MRCHLQMLDAVLTGDGLAAVAPLAAEAAGGPVAVVVPRLGVAAASPGGEAALPGDPALRRRAGPRPCGARAARGRGRGADRVAVTSGSAASCCSSPRRPDPEAVEFLHLAAVAALTEVAVEEAREEVEENVRGSFLEELRERRRDARPGRRRPARGAARLRRRAGAVALRRADHRAPAPRRGAGVVGVPGRARPARRGRGRGPRLRAAARERRRRADDDDGPPPARSPRACSATASSRCPPSTTTRRARPGDPGGRKLASSKALGRGDGLGGPIQEGIGTGTYSAAVPRARLASGQAARLRSTDNRTRSHPFVRYDATRTGTDLISDARKAAPGAHKPQA